MLGTLVEGRYRVHELVGAGAMGEVYRAEHVALGRAVAIKLVAAGLATHPAARARFAREARAQARLSHPHVIATLDYGVHGDRPYLVLEYVAGETLEAQIDRARFAVPAGLALAIQIADGLGAAHALGIVHRDVKPGNVLVTADGRAKLGDFGLAIGGDATRLTAAGQPVGTPAYVAPEQAWGAPVDARADVYALGCTLHELFTGVPPYPGNAMEVLLQHLHAEVPRVGHRADGIPAELDELIATMMAKPPADRPADAGAVAARLRAILAQLGRSTTAVVVVAGAIPATAARAVTAIVAAAGGTEAAAPRCARFADAGAAFRAATEIARLGDAGLRVAVHAGHPDDRAVVDCAARLAALASPGEPAVSDAVLAALGAGARGSLAPRGALAAASPPVVVYRACGPCDTSAPCDATAAGAWDDRDVVFDCPCGARGRVVAPRRASRYDARCAGCGGTCRVEVDPTATTAAPDVPTAIVDAIALIPRASSDAERLLAELANLE